MITKVLKEEIINTDIPKKINIGDPYYYEDESLSKYKIDKLTYNKTFRGKSDWKCQVILNETYTEDEYVQFSSNSVNIICSADTKLIELLKKDSCYNYIEIKNKCIGIDTSEYIFKVNNNELLIQVGDDGYIATILDFYKGKELVAIKIYLEFGDILSYEECKKSLEYLFDKNFED